jgi:hypothetical protein
MQLTSRLLLQGLLVANGAIAAGTGTAVVVAGPGAIPGAVPGRSWARTPSRPRASTRSRRRRLARCRRCTDAARSRW